MLTTPTHQSISNEFPPTWDLEGTPRGNSLPSLASRFTRGLGVVRIAKGKISLIFLILAGRKKVTGTTAHHCSS